MQLLQKIILDTKVLQLRKERVRHVSDMFQSKQARNNGRWMNWHCLPRDKWDELALFFKKFNCQTTKTTTSFFAKLPNARPWKRKPHVPRPRLWRTIPSSRRPLGFSGEFFFKLGKRGPCLNWMLLHVETLQSNLMRSCTCSCFFF